MRLINTDELQGLARTVVGQDNRTHSAYFKTTIDNAPTVKAIPIEWIKHWCLKHYPTYPRIITEELLKKTETWRMIDNWEKENANNKTE